MKKKTISLLLVCFIVIIGSLVIGSKKGGEFGGADDQIEDTIKETNANYEPWFSSFWEPPSGEIESLLFAVQAAIGAGFIGFYIGKKSNVKVNNGSVQEK
ncbi:cobalt/nickel transport protein [Clostridium tetanomorphum]|uniref:Cobalt transport protein CbiN n=1 Tax=Clostridium tetanomorphum TaxID=1553 RepID=A0A923E9W4_CLOTT|nr:MULTISPECIES: energy-coupling factor ABC transporter substrate-binding protein [Clostridium]KAJ50335.1 cobalt transport protein [Clostridium tetanomorphum DSM 665]MBC2397774.1 energy-coupling factor ABC transporter substrate-binding protein [Clostridium tetanomorphum]MBC2425646.1 energy-coupling factor ABC transporter substrate-binding protein [Clostridium beijerinckii]MBP1866052.1 cobalt/nickel transport protein [Clostridium tetanomorphum]NRS83268.1 cobalt/nickel transport protein [Clostri